ncbi:MAG TPA: prepilin-type N-terminal cleavage/methylation domain-containing protein [Phycisphaerae bacterium]|nr:prepilin-type N-terminal cleavage/methylation domain-containing protein [Phycisphaerae bacterium]
MQLRAKSRRSVGDGGEGGVAARRRGFTLFELVLVVLVVGICAATLLPAVGNLRSTSLRQAANMVAADADFCMSECVNRPTAPRKLVFNVGGNSYQMVDATTNAVIAHPADGLPYINDFSTGRNVQLSGVRLVSVLVGGISATALTYTAYGKPVLTSDMVITLSYEGQTMAVTVKAGTGDVGIQ